MKSLENLGVQALSARFMLAKACKESQTAWGETLKCHAKCVGRNAKIPRKMRGGGDLLSLSLSLVCQFCLFYRTLVCLFQRKNSQNHPKIQPNSRFLCRGREFLLKFSQKFSPFSQISPKNSRHFFSFFSKISNFSNFSKENHKFCKFFQKIFIKVAKTTARVAGVG